jgi:tetratricopeptide (TPR) repeat protein
VGAENTESYGGYLYIAGDLLSASDDDRGIKLIERSQQYLPKDAELAATLAGIYIMSDRTADAKKQAELSLSIQPRQARVYIDLANAEWILGNIQAAKKHAQEAKKLRPDLPGPNATLAFVAIDEGDLKAAKEFSEEGSRISEKHRFFQTVLAAYEATAGNAAKARTIMNEAWGSDQPSEEMLKTWFFRRKPLENILSLRK